MKIFERTPEQKADDAIQYKLFKVWGIMFITCMTVLIADRAIFGKMPNMSRAESIFFAVISVNFVQFVPMVLRSNWGKILKKVILSTLWVSIVLVLVERFIVI